MSTIYILYRVRFTFMLDGIGHVFLEVNSPFAYLIIGDGILIQDMDHHLIALGSIEGEDFIPMGFFSSLLVDFSLLPGVSDFDNDIGVLIKERFTMLENVSVSWVSMAEMGLT